MKSDFLTHSYLDLREKLFRSAIAFLKNEEDAKDAMQDTYMNLWSKNPVTSDSEAGNKLFKALRNRCIDIIKRQSRQKQAFENHEEPIENPLDECIEDYERQLISNLSKRQREVYQYIVWEGLEYEKVADITGRSLEAVRTEMSRIRKKIQSNLKRDDI